MTATWVDVLLSFAWVAIPIGLLIAINVLVLLRCRPGPEDKDTRP